MMLGRQTLLRLIGQKKPGVICFSRPLSNRPEVVVDKLTGESQGVAVVGLNRVSARNALGRELSNQLEDSLKELSRDSSLRVLVLRSLVKGVFCSGADLKERLNMTQPEVYHFVTQLRSIANQIQDFPTPTIAAIDGAALGGGLEMALACDLRVAASPAKMGLVETKLAIIPGAGGTQRLSRLIGSSRAKELIFTGRILDGKEAHEQDIVNHVVEQNSAGDAAYERALELAEEIVTQGPVALRMAKLAINKGMDVDINSGLAFESTCYAQVIPTKDRLEGLEAFREKRPPRYRGE